MIFVGMPIYGAKGRRDFDDLPGPVAVSLAAGRAALGPHVFARLNDAVIDRARAELVGEFLATECTHLLFWDADVAIPTAGVRALVASQHAVTAIPQTRRGSPGLFSVGGYDATTQTASECGFGAIIIARHVFEQVCAAHPELSCRSTVDRARMICAMFWPLIVDGEMLSEDYAFLRRSGERVHLLVEHEVEHDGLRGKFPG